MSVVSIWRNGGGGSRAKSTEKATYRVPEEATLVSDVLVAVAIVCVWLALQLLVLGGLSEQRAQNVMYGRFRTELAAATAPTGGVITLGKPVSLLSVGGQSLVVAEGTDGRTMLDGPGHLRSTVLPGQSGTSVVYGRSRTYGRPFAHIAELAVGSTIKAVTAQGRSTYVVTGVRHAGDPLPQPLTGTAGRLTLVTGSGSGQLADLSAGSVVYVDAKLTSKPYTAPGGRYSAVTGAEIPMARDFSSLPVLTLALAGLVGCVVVGSLLRRKVPDVVAWLLVAGPLLALLWVSTDLAMALLPNLV